MVTHRDKLAAAPPPQADLAGWGHSIALQLEPTGRSLFENAVAVFAELKAAAGDSDIAKHAFLATELLADLGFDAETLAATLLLDAFEQQAVSADVVRARVSDAVVELLEGVQRMHVIDVLHRTQRSSAADAGQWEALRRMLFAMASDVRVVIVTLAWVVARLRTAKYIGDSAQRELARNVLDLYAPLANRLGIWQIKWELEDLALRYLEPERYKELARLLEERRVDREEYINRFIAELQGLLHSAGVAAEVKGRPKHIYSIWRKMQRKNLGFDEIFDIRAVRVVVDSVAECYAVLGVVHSHWDYVRSEFDDYIAAPKDNMYQSLHTAVIGPESKVVEVQIRTRDMDAHAELGVAAHWRYKEGAGIDLTLERKLNWLRQLLEWRDTVVPAPTAIASAQQHGERIYVFTPKGKIIDLPAGATPLDFAYHVHTDVGHRCRGAKVGGKIVPLTSTLRNGDVVEIVTVKQGGPSRDWLNPAQGYVKSAKAHDKVAQWFKQQHFDEHVAQGRAQLEKELHRAHLTDVNFERLAQRFEYGEPDKLFAALGRGDLKISQILNALQQAAAPAEPVPRIATPQRTTRDRSDVYVEGEGNVLTHFARCCKPVPGDAIVGYITRGRGVTIHRPNCANITRYYVEEPERLIEATWGRTADATYSVDVQIVAADRQGLLRDITSVLANEKINVTATSSLSDAQSNQAFITFTLQIRDVEQLDRVLAQIRQLPSVVSVRRP